MDKPEIILNLWYVHDDLGYIYSLRVRCYIGVGSDQEKLRFLQQHANLDYLVAKPFPIPKRLHVNGMAVYHKAAMDLLGNPIELFKDAIQAMERELPAQTKLSIPKRPLVCLTPLIGNDRNEIFPNFSESSWFSES